MTDPSSSDYESFQKKAAQIFSYLDINKDGTLSYDELKRGFHELKLPVATHEDLYREFDVNPTKHVTKEQFDKYVQAQYLKVKELFDKLDIQRDYRITQHELTTGLQKFDPSYQFSDESIRKVFSAVDKNKDGSISFDEWCEFLILMPKLNIKEVINYWETVVTIVDPNEFALYGIQGTKPPVAEATGKYAEVKKWLISLGSGLFAGVVSRTSTAPLERLKLIYQIRYKGAEQPPGIFTGLKDIVKQDGIKGLFRGNLITCLRAGPETSIKLAAFDKQTAALTQYRGGGPLGSGDLFLAGATSGVIAAGITHPLGVIKTRLAAAPSGTYSGITDVIKKMASAEGKVLPFFKGLQPTIIAVVPLSGLNLMSYEMLKNVFIGKNPTKEPSTLTFMMIGGLSAFLSSTLLYPSQILTARMMMQGMGGEQQKGMIGITKDILKYEGPKGFFKGFTAAMSKIIIGNSISYGCFEFLKKSVGHKGNK